MKKILGFFLVGFLLAGAHSKAQTYNVPVNYKFSSPEDFKKYEPQVVETVQWLQITPWTEDVAKRRAANAFLFKWIQNTPTITMTVMPPLIELTDKNNQLMSAFMGGYVRYAIQHPNCTKEEANDAAVKMLIAKYRSEPTRKKDEDIERLIRMERDGQLQAWVRDEYENAAPAL